MSHWAQCYLLHDLPNNNNAFQNNAFEFITDSLCKSQLSVLCFCHGLHQIWHEYSQRRSLRLEFRGEAERRQSIGVETVSLNRERRRRALGLSFLVLPMYLMYWHFLSVSAQCVFVSVSISVCAFWQCPRFCMKFHQSVCTHKSSDTHLEKNKTKTSPACSRSETACVVRVHGFRPANKRSNMPAECEGAA